uniref:Uncharacterized protein n=1 Tax=viral metagenome TaxID=1070528 RepID=A0A6C0I5C1_9ZZZZ
MIKFLDDEELLYSLDETNNSGYILNYRINTELETPFLEWSVNAEKTDELESVEKLDGYKGFVEVKIDDQQYVVAIVNAGPNIGSGVVTVPYILENPDHNSISYHALNQKPILQTIYNDETGEAYPSPLTMYLCSPSEHQVSKVEGIGMAFLFSFENHGVHNNKYAVFVDGALNLAHKDKPIQDGEVSKDYDCILFYKGEDKFVAVKTVDRFAKIKR